MTALCNLNKAIGPIALPCGAGIVPIRIGHWGQSMAYGDGQPRSVGRVIVGVLAFVAAYGGAKALVHGGFDWWTHRPAQLEAGIADARRENPSVDRMYGAMERHFPEEYANFKDAMKKRLGQSASNDELKVAGFNYMREFTKTHLIDVAHAPSASLKDYRESQQQVLRVLHSESIELCAHYSMTGLRPDDSMSAYAKSALADAVAIQIRVAADGKRNPVMRNTREVGEKDSIVFVQSLMKSGLTDDDVQMFSDPKRIEVAPAEQQCRIGEAMLQALNKMPTDQSDRVLAIIVTST